MSREKRIDRGKSKGLLKDYLVMNNALWDEIKRKLCSHLFLEIIGSIVKATKEIDAPSQTDLLKGSFLFFASALFLFLNSRMTPIQSNHEQYDGCCHRQCRLQSYLDSTKLVWRIQRINLRTSSPSSSIMHLTESNGNLQTYRYTITIDCCTGFLVH